MSVEKRAADPSDADGSPKRPKTGDGSSELPFSKTETLPLPFSEAPEPETAIQETAIQKVSTPVDALGPFNVYKGDYDYFPVQWQFESTVELFPEKAKPVAGQILNKTMQLKMFVSAPSKPDPEFFRVQCVNLLAQVGDQ